MKHSERLNWLQETDPQRLESLWQQADNVRRQHVGDAVHLRGLVELSNYCARLCGYCGLRAPNHELLRYRMSADEVLSSARRAVELGFGTVVLQAGEDAGLTTDRVTDLIHAIKHETDLAITLSLGERSFKALTTWRKAGAARYLLRFETSNADLLARIHPPRNTKPVDRLGLLRQLRELGYEVGSGVMIGIPGQRYADLVRDLELFEQLDLDMVGVGPFVPHPQTPLGQAADAYHAGADQVPNDARTTYVMIALTRLARPLANIPSTTSLATLHGAAGQLLALQRGANVLMPNLTPAHYRENYQIYPEKACYYDDSPTALETLRTRLAELGRTTGAGRGDAPNFARRRHLTPTHSERIRA